MSKSRKKDNTMGRVLSSSTTQPSKNFKKKEEDVWENEQFCVLDKILFYIPLDVQLTLLALQEKFPSPEFSILGKAHWNPEDEGYNMDPEIFIPKQKVSTGSVDIEEDNLEYNVVIHKHPNGCKTFSGTDEDYINSNFEFSLLWESKKFCKATGKIWVQAINSHIRVELDPVIYGLDAYLPENYKNIEEKTFTHKGGHSYAHGLNDKYLNPNRYQPYYGGIDSPVDFYKNDKEVPRSGQDFLRETWKRNAEEKNQEFVKSLNFSKAVLEELKKSGCYFDEDGDLIDSNGFVSYTSDELQTITESELREFLREDSVIVTELEEEIDEELAAIHPDLI